MSRLIPGRDLALAGSVQLRSCASRVSSPVRSGPAPPPTPSIAVLSPSIVPPPVEAVPTTAIDDLWAAYFDTPSQARRDQIVVHYTPLVRAVAHRIAAGCRLCRARGLVQSGVLRADRCGGCASTRSGDLGSRATRAQRIRGAILDELRARTGAAQRAVAGSGAGSGRRNAWRASCCAARPSASWPPRWGCRFATCRPHPAGAVDQRV